MDETIQITMTTGTTGSTMDTDISEKDANATMLAKAIGLKDEDGKELFDIDVEPFVSARTKANWKPSREELNKEVLRRYYSFEDKPSARVPGKNWGLAKCKAWLIDNPITEVSDVEFIRNEIEEFKSFLATESAAADCRNKPRWQTDMVYYRLIHCFLDNRSLDAKNREELDGRNSEEVRTKNVYELIADKMNDPNYCVKTDCYPDLHEKFRNGITLSHASMGNVGIITETKVKEKIA